MVSIGDQNLQRGMYVEISSSTKTMLFLLCIVHLNHYYIIFSVLSGRGGATNSHSGNQSFRCLVKQYQGDYLKAKKRDKPQVASIVCEKIRERGGRFLGRYKTENKGMVWIDIGDARAIEKTCQALREGAPAIRRKKAAVPNNDGILSATLTFDRAIPAEDEEENTPTYGGRTQIVRTKYETGMEETDATIGMPLVIRPSMMLLCRSSDQQLVIPVDDLDEGERQMYLNDFLPPNPAVEKKKAATFQTVITPTDGIVYYDTSSTVEENPSNVLVNV